MINYKAILLSGLMLGSLGVGYAGNKDRAGSSGGSELLINPWARSSGLAGSSIASCMGIESVFLNVAGLAFTEKTELMFTNTNWLSGSDISINSFGLSQAVGESGVIGLTVSTMSFGEINVTTTENPDGGLGTYSPSLSNIGISYAKEFSNSIYGGLTLKVISQSISNASARGIAFDAGIKYVTGETDQVKFGITLKNVGPPYQFEGDGLSFVTGAPLGATEMTVEQRSEKYELPALISIGTSYDFNFTEVNKLTVSGAFTSNSFSPDQFLFGAEFGYKSLLKLRAGYAFETKEGGTEIINALTGPSAGISLDIPTGDKGGTLSFDYSYRVTNPFSGIHSIGARINMK